MNPNTKDELDKAIKVSSGGVPGVAIHTLEKKLLNCF